MIATLTASDWEVLIPLIGSQLVLIVQAWHNNRNARTRGVETLRQVTPPSNGHTLGELAEATVNAGTVAAVEATRLRQAIDPTHPPVEPAIPAAEVPKPVLDAQTVSPPPLPPTGPSGAN
jgi:hypothetical protein